MTFSQNNLDSGSKIKDFLERKGFLIKGYNALESSQNYIILPDTTSFNWKKKNSQIRVNCKKEAMNIIEYNTKLKHIDNGVGDPTREYSFLLDNYADFITVLKALEKIEINCK